MITPIEEPALCSQLREIIDLQLADKRGAWDMQPDGTYIQRTPGLRIKNASSQEQCIQKSAKRLAEAKRQFKKQKYRKKMTKRKNL